MFVMPHSRFVVRDAPRGIFLEIIVNFVLFCCFSGARADEKRKQDARIAQLEEEVEEERTQNELLLEKYKRANMQVC